MVAQYERMQEQIVNKPKKSFPLPKKFTNPIAKRQKICYNSCVPKNNRILILSRVVEGLAL